MSLRDEIRAELIDLDVTDIKIDKDADIHGTPATEIRIFVDAKGQTGAVVNTEHIFQFAKESGMTAHQIADVIDSYIRSGIDEAMV